MRAPRRCDKTMTEQQFERWQDFALRMARTCYRTARRPSTKWIVQVLQDFFDRLDDVDVSLIVNWDNSSGHGYCVSDMLMELLDDYAASPGPCRACSTGDYGAECCCQKMRALYYEQWGEQWGGPAHCCIRAGLDRASAPSAGVVGFTAGDVRRMYPEGVPDWVFPSDARLCYWLSGKANGTFSELPDTAGVVL